MWILLLQSALDSAWVRLSWTRLLVNRLAQIRSSKFEFSFELPVIYCIRKLDLSWPSTRLPYGHQSGKRVQRERSTNEPLKTILLGDHTRGRYRVRGSLEQFLLSVMSPVNGLSLSKEFRLQHHWTINTSSRCLTPSYRSSEYRYKPTWAFVFK